MAAEFFTGKISAARLLSNRLGYGPLPAAGDEVEQHLCLWDNGRAHLHTFCYGDGVDYPEHRNEQLEPAACNDLLQQLADLFRQPPELPYASDCGDWSLTLTNSEGRSFHFSGSLCPGEPRLERISDLLREALELPELFALDGNASSDRIERITLDYRRRALPGEGRAAAGSAKWRHQEYLTLDRQTGMVEHSQNGGGLRARRSIHAPQQVAELLDRFDPGEFPGTLPLNKAAPELAAEIAVTVTLLHGGCKTLAGPCEIGTLPGELGELLRAVQDFLADCCRPELFTL